METTLINVPGSLAEKLELAAVNVQEVPSDIFSEPATPPGLQKSLDFSASRQSLTHNRRTVSRMSHRSTSFMHSHRYKMSSELTAQAESKFLSLMEFMSCASREASLLKEYWVKIIAERESWCREREELCEKITEVTTELEHRHSDRTKIDIEIGEKNKKIEKLTLELSAALACVSTEKKKVIECEHELEHTREELHEVKETLSRTHMEYEKTRTELETTEICLKTAIVDRDCAREDAEKHHKELTKVIRERTEISSKLVDITSKYESSRKEVISLTERVKTFEHEREEYLLDCDRFKDEARKCRNKYEESCKELHELTERYERLQRDISKVRETLKIVESERDEYCHTIECLRRDCKAITCARDEWEEKCSDITLKYEHCRRELTTCKTRLRELEIERTETLEVLERVREEHRVIVIERDELKDELHTCHKRLEECKRQVVALTETLQKTEKSLSESRTEIHTLTERVRHVECERDEARHKCGSLSTEIIELKEKIVFFQAEITVITEARNKIRIEFERIQEEYCRITETISCSKDDSEALECEIDNLRCMLRETREQKERAITARNSADHERDEFIAKYEEKCREIERMEENCSTHHHGHVRIGGHAERHIITTDSSHRASSAFQITDN